MIVSLFLGICICTEEYYDEQYYLEKGQTTSPKKSAHTVWKNLDKIAQLIILTRRSTVIPVQV
jgi:hypothetical protein